MCSQLLIVAHSRMLTMDCEALDADLDLIESIGGKIEAAERMRDSIASLSEMNPFFEEAGSAADSLKACTTAIRLQAEAERCESRGDYAGAAAAHEFVATELGRLPYRPGLDARGQEAKSSAARCRSLAGIPEPAPCNIKNW